MVNLFWKQKIIDEARRRYQSLSCRKAKSLELLNINIMAEERIFGILWIYKVAQSGKDLDYELKGQGNE